MSTPPQPAPPKDSYRFSHRQSVGLVFLCTLFGVVAQALIKHGAASLHSASVIAMISNKPVFFGYALYGVSTALLILALRDGELSLLYPVISLTYVWVTIVSVTIFNEKLTVSKLAGITIICLGVALLGKGSSKE